jgi:hypothetical protein
MRKTAEDYGRIAASMDPGEKEHFMVNCLAKEEAWVNEFKEKKPHQVALLEARRAKTEEELDMRGNLSQSVSHENLVRAAFTFVLLLTCLPGEFIFSRWIVIPFGFGPVETNLIAATVLIISTEGMNVYITALRKKYPHLEENLFLIIGSVGFLLILMLIFFGAELRQSLYQTNLAVTDSSLDETVKAADKFFKGPFMYFMLVLTTATVLISGYAYHDFKNRCFMAIAFLKLHREIERTTKTLAKLDQEEVEYETNLRSFNALFNHGMMMEKHKIETSNGNSFGGQFQRNVSQNIGFIIASPIFLALIVLIIFLMFRGTAKAETIIFLDLSRSSEAIDYSGKESEFQKNIKGIENYIQNHLVPGERIRIIGITERSFSTPYTLVDAKATTNKGYFNEVISKDKMRILQLFRKTNVKATASMTDIMGSVQLASVLFSPSDREKKLIFLSDMRQYTRDLDLETPKVIDADSTMKELISKGLVPSLNNVKVWCLGVHSSGKSAGYWNSLKDFWIRYFRQAKANQTIVFTMERGF